MWSTEGAYPNKNAGLGLTSGLAVMPMACGPAVFYVFVPRWKGRHPGAAEKTCNP